MMTRSQWFPKSLVYKEHRGGYSEISRMLRFFRIGVTKRRDLTVAVEILEKFDVKTTIHWGLNRAEKDQGLSMTYKYEA